MSEYLWVDPWSGRQLPYPEYAMVLYGRMKLARARRYRLRRIWQQIRGRPVDPTEHDLWLKLCSVARREGLSNPFDFGPIQS